MGLQAPLVREKAALEGRHPCWRTPFGMLHRRLPGWGARPQPRPRHRGEAWRAEPKNYTRKEKGWGKEKKKKKEKRGAGRRMTGH